ncbi:hypothetical protein [Methylomicrobium sp. Wu6]|uniref:hypothetical protein n=1 Tax=Methylomicrobium sp. Wu6 TaxID=3107928 RepID=UPI002DD62DA2|nr:hypothetical protein [Methylomicrobium sp. Wu6]MEC4747524.1 hypothetical protein [Methylomicrobium sp. Wu6]
MVKKYNPNPWRKKSGGASIMMNFSKFWLTLLLPVFGLSCAAKPVVKQEVIARGVGTNLHEAKNDAIRQGIQYVAGSYVTSDIEAEGEIIIKDTLTDYSGAIVDRFEILNQTRRADGLYEIQARLHIAGDAVRQRNRSGISEPGLVDGQSLHAEVSSRLKRKADSKRLWEDLLSGFPERAFRYAIVNPSISTVPNDTRQASLNFYSQVIWRADFLDEFSAVLKATGRPVRAAKNGSSIILAGDEPNYEQSGICLMNDFRNQSPWQEVNCYIIDVPSKSMEKWLCIHTGVTMDFTMQGFDAGALSFAKNSWGDLTPFLGTEHGRFALIFVFYLVDEERVKEKDVYNKLVSASWSVKVPTDVLSEIKNISAQAKCS